MLVQITVWETEGVYKRGQFEAISTHLAVIFYCENNCDISMGAHSAMAPYTKMLQAGKKRHEEEDSNDLLDTDAIGSVETSPPDMDDVLSSVYGKIRGFRRNKDLEDEHKVAASKSAVVKGAA